MKILVMSLLRVGDLIQQRPLIQQLRHQYPSAEIHLLVNPASTSSEVLFPEVNRWITFPRDLLQKEIGTAEVVMMKPLHTLEAFLAPLKQQSYDLLVNMTHNRLSGFLSEVIPSAEKRGLIAEGKGFRLFENEWIRHFNQNFSSKQGAGFHYIEILSRALGLQVPTPSLLTPKGECILFQPLTSDSKKNFHLTSWVKVFESIRRDFSSSPIKILGAPFERDLLRSFFDDDDLAICDWAELEILLRSARMLVTGDTSVKHLAAQMGVPVFELALGSSAPERTGVYAVGARILQTKISCAPCPHQGPCRQMSHQCGDQMNPDLVAQLISDHLKGEPLSLVPSPMRLEETSLQSGAFWGFTSEASFQIFERLALASFLDGEERDVPNQIKADLSPHDLLASQAKLENLYNRLHQELVDLTTLFSKEKFPSESFEICRTRIRLLLTDGVLAGYGLSDLLVQPCSHPLQYFGMVRRQWEVFGRRILMRKKMIVQIMEEENGKSLRNEAERNFDAT